MLKVLLSTKGHSGREDWTHSGCSTHGDFEQRLRHLDATLLGCAADHCSCRTGAEHWIECF